MIRTLTRGCVVALLMCEFLLSGVGYCGHTHTHVHPGAGCGIGFTESDDGCADLPHAHPPQPGDAGGDDSHRGSHRCHCFCLGHVDAETAGLSGSVYFLSTIIQPLPASLYDVHVMRVIFHPPISA
ncbi:hypothetical protein JXO52_09065 [bacterium]|nr:hypothetical protein [bacterium]